MAVAPPCCSSGAFAGGVSCESDMAEERGRKVEEQHRRDVTLRSQAWVRLRSLTKTDHSKSTISYARSPQKQIVAMEAHRESERKGGGREEICGGERDDWE